MKNINFYVYHKKILQSATRRVGNIMGKVIQHPSSGRAIFSEMARAETLSQLQTSIGRIATIRFKRDHLQEGFQALELALNKVCPPPKQTFDTTYLMAEQFARMAPRKYTASIWRHAFNFMASRSTSHEAVQQFMQIAEEMGTSCQPR